MTSKVRSFSDEASAAAALREELVNTLASPPEFGPRVVMLAGGTTPLRVYGQIAEDPPDLVASGTWLLLSDDRHVPHEDERSNYGKIQRMASSLGVSGSRVIYPDPELPPAESASDFGIHIATPARSGADFELGILGIGADGHTASLFSPDLVPASKDAATIATGTPVFTSPDELALAAGVQDGVERVSVSATVLLCFRRLVFFAPGDAKGEILREILRTPHRYPAGRILMQHPAAEIWTDQTLDPDAGAD